MLRQGQLEKVECLNSEQWTGAMTKATKSLLAQSIEIWKSKSKSVPPTMSIWSGRSLSCWARAWIFFLAFFNVISRDSRPTPELKAPVLQVWFKLQTVKIRWNYLQNCFPRLLSDQLKQKCQWLNFLREHFPQTEEEKTMSHKLIEWTIEFKTWTSDTMIPDSRTVPQAVHTESALKIRRLIPWWTWSSCNIHQRVTYVSELDLNRKKNFGKPKQNEQNLMNKI